MRAMIFFLTVFLSLQAVANQTPRNPYIPVTPPHDAIEPEYVTNWPSIIRWTASRWQWQDPPSVITDLKKALGEIPHDYEPE